MDKAGLLDLLRRMGRLLEIEHPDMPVVQLVLVGGAAGMLAGELRPGRVTTDCDVSKVEPATWWNVIQDVAVRIGSESGLSKSWLSLDCARYQNLMPPGWERRCRRAATFGRLEIHTISHRDFAASKAVGVDKRPQDREDLSQLKLTREDFDSVLRNFDRLEAESLNKESFAVQRQYVEELRARHDQK